VKHSFFYLSLLIILGCISHAANRGSDQVSSNSSNKFVACANDLEKQTHRSQELQRIVKEDQADRQIPGEEIDWNNVAAADESGRNELPKFLLKVALKKPKITPPPHSFFNTVLSPITITKLIYGPNARLN
jgi:hypothetical protein